MTQSERATLRQLVRGMYDYQRLRLQGAGRSDTKLRGGKKKRPVAVEIDSADLAVIEKLSDGLLDYERLSLREIERRVKAHPEGRWLLAQKGIGPTLAGAFLSEVDFARADTVSAVWKFMGLDVVAGHAPRRTKGVKNPYNSWLRTKVLGVGGDCILKACVRVTRPQDKDGWTEAAWERASMHEDTEATERASSSESTVPDERAVDLETPATSERADHQEPPDPLVRRFVCGYARLYADRRWRRLHQVGPCMLCDGTGYTAKRAEVRENPAEVERAEPIEHPRLTERADVEETPTLSKRADLLEPPVVRERAAPTETPASRKRCSNCGGTGTGPWGRGSAHRHRDAIRHTMKLLIRDWYIVARTAMGLPVRPSYAEEYLGKKHHAGRIETPVLGERADREPAALQGTP